MLAFVSALAGFGALFYLQAALWESLFHEYILDLTPARRERVHRLRRLLPMLWAIHVDHAVLHHHRTFRRSHVEMFSGAGEEARLQAVLRSQFPARIARGFVETRYGSTFTWRGMVPFALPVWLNLCWLLVLPPGPAALGCLAANIVFSTPYLALSKWVHPYMHRRFDDALTEAPSVIGWVLGSTFGLAIRVSHFVHHRDPRVNFNLQFGMDRPRGRWRAPTPGEWDEMLALGLVTPRHRARLEGRTFLGHPF